MGRPGSVPKVRIALEWNQFEFVLCSYIHCLPSEPQADPGSGSSPASWPFPGLHSFVSLWVSSTTTPRLGLDPLQQESGGGGSSGFI